MTTDDNQISPCYTSMARGIHWILITTRETSSPIISNKYHIVHVLLFNFYLNIIYGDMFRRKYQNVKDIEMECVWNIFDKYDIYRGG